MKIVVFTALCGRFGDTIKPPLNTIVRDGDEIHYVCFTDQPLVGIEPYVTRAFPWVGDDPRRTSRWPKINSILAFPDADITIWHDACYQMLNVYNLLDSLSPEWEFCTFRHPSRRRLEDEIRACFYWKKESWANLTKQLTRYREEGMPTTKVLYENSCIARKNTPNVKKINELWWVEYMAESCRDQISLPYVFWKLDYKDWKPIAGSRMDNPFFFFEEHKSDNTVI